MWIWFWMSTYMVLCLYAVKLFLQSIFLIKVLLIKDYKATIPKENTLRLSMLLIRLDTYEIKLSRVLKQVYLARRWICQLKNCTELDWTELNCLKLLTYSLQIFFLSFKWVFVNKEWVDLQTIRISCKNWLQYQ